MGRKKINYEERLEKIAERLEDGESVAVNNAMSEIWTPGEPLDLDEVKEAGIQLADETNSYSATFNEYKEAILDVGRGIVQRVVDNGDGSIDLLYRPVLSRQAPMPESYSIHTPLSVILHYVQRTVNQEMWGINDVSERNKQAMLKWGLD